MAGRFDVTFPLVLKWDRSFSITFTLQKGNQIAFDRGIYYFEGDNGSGKTTFISMLSLTAGRIGNKTEGAGTIFFNGQAYNETGFDALKAADIREKDFCIFPQKAFFLPVSARDNYLILNGSDPLMTGMFSDSLFPDLMSGGQQQKILMDIVLDEKRPVWFLDEPLNSLDAERQNYFWQKLKTAYEKEPITLFFIDHMMRDQIKGNPDFSRLNTLRVFTENPHREDRSEIEYKQIHIYVNDRPERFFSEQIQKAAQQSIARKRYRPLSLKGDWGAAQGGA